MTIFDGMSKIFDEFNRVRKIQEQEILDKNGCKDFQELSRKYDQMRLGKLLYGSPEKMN